MMITRISAYLLLFLILIQVSCNQSQNKWTDNKSGNSKYHANEEGDNKVYEFPIITPEWSRVLDDRINETSGLILWNGALWTINDDSDTRIYKIDTASAEIIGDYFLPGVVNCDWEEIAQDDAYIYIGDFGNNSGSRKDLHILRVEKISLNVGTPSIDTIWFSYSDQHDYASSGVNQTEYDCEAFVVTSDSMFLFTKQWLTASTTVYALTKEPGVHTAEKRNSFAIGGLVTGATYQEQKGLLVLCGYSGIFQPFLYLFFNYPDHQFFSGNEQRINLSILFHQVEGVATEDGLTYYVTNEYSGFRSTGVYNFQKLHLFNLDPYFEEYLVKD